MMCERVYSFRSMFPLIFATYDSYMAYMVSFFLLRLFYSPCRHILKLDTRTQTHKTRKGLICIIERLPVNRGRQKTVIFGLQWSLYCTISTIITIVILSFSTVCVDGVCICEHKICIIISDVCKIEQYLFSKP